MAKLRLGFNSVIAILCVVLVVLLVHIFYPKREDFFVSCTKGNDKKYNRKHRISDYYYDLEKNKFVKGVADRQPGKFEEEQIFKVLVNGGNQKNLKSQRACKRYRAGPVNGYRNRYFDTDTQQWTRCPKNTTYSTNEMINEGAITCLPCPTNYEDYQYLRNIDANNDCPVIDAPPPATTKAPDMSYEDCKTIIDIGGWWNTCKRVKEGTRDPNPNFINDCVENGACGKK